MHDDSQHSFGGSPLDRYVYEFEMPDPGGMGDPGLGDPTPPDPAPAPEAPAWSGPSQDEWGAVMGYVQAQQQREQQIAQVYGVPGSQQQETPDFYDDPDAWLEAKLAPHIQPIQQYTDETRMAEAEERAMDILTDNATREGEFDKEIARMRAESLLPDMQRKYGATPQAAEAALEAAAHQQRAYEQQQRERYVAEHTNHISTLAGAPGEPGSSYTVGVQQRTMPDYTKTGGSVASRFFGPGREV